MEKLQETYGKDVKFLMVYIREAHPIDGWKIQANERDGIMFKQPTTLEERFGVAKAMCDALEISIPGVVDEMDNKVNAAYSAWPDRLYLVGRDGKIAYQGEHGPRGFKPDELETAIKKELAPEQAGENNPSERDKADEN